MTVDRAALAPNRAHFFRDEPGAPVQFYFSNPERGVAVDAPATAEHKRIHPDAWEHFERAEEAAAARAATADAEEPSDDDE